MLIRNTQKKQEAQSYQKGCCLFKSSFLKPLSQLELDLVGMFFGCSSKKFMFFWLVESTQMKQEIQRCQKGCCQYTVQTCIPFTIENYMNHQLLQIRDMTHGCLMPLSWRGRHGHGHGHMQSLPITTNVVSLKPSQSRWTQYKIMW